MKVTAVYALALAFVVSILNGSNSMIGINAFQIQSMAHPITQQPLSSIRTTSTSLNVFGKKKISAEDQAKRDLYWQGEWVCKDCGYIYNRVG